MTMILTNLELQNTSVPTGCKDFFGSSIAIRQNCMSLWCSPCVIGRKKEHIRLLSHEPFALRYSSNGIDCNKKTKSLSIDIFFDNFFSLHNSTSNICLSALSSFLMSVFSLFIGLLSVRLSVNWTLFKNIKISSIRFFVSLWKFIYWITAKIETYYYTLVNTGFSLYLSMFQSANRYHVGKFFLEVFRWFQTSVRIWSSTCRRFTVYQTPTLVQYSTNRHLLPRKIYRTMQRIAKCCSCWHLEKQSYIDGTSIFRSQLTHDFRSYIQLVNLINLVPSQLAHFNSSSASHQFFYSITFQFFWFQGRRFVVYRGLGSLD